MASSTSDKNWAIEHLIDPLHEPSPAEEAGLAGTYAPNHIPKASMVNVQNTGSSTSTNPFRREPKPTDLITSSKNTTSTRTRAVSNGSNSTDSPRKEAFGAYIDDAPRRSTSSQRERGPPVSSSTGKNTRPRRSSSLREKYPGDPSVRPLDQLTREAKAAHRSPHLKKKHLPGRDSIDKLDDVSFLGQYHHEGPYDAASLARNNSHTISPVAAVANSNREALRATPTENIRDAIERHRPLDGVSSVPPGMTDEFGRTYKYKEGLEEDMMRNGKPEGGVYKQWPGIDYLPEDLKGKGEPSYSIEKALKKRNTQGDDVELVERPRRVDERLDIDSGEPYRDSSPFKDNAGATSGEQALENEGGVGSSTGAAGVKYGEWEKEHRKSGSGGLDGLKRRIGSLRRKDK